MSRDDTLVFSVVFSFLRNLVWSFQTFLKKLWLLYGYMLNLGYYKFDDFFISQNDKNV